MKFYLVALFLIFPILGHSSNSVLVKEHSQILFDVDYLNVSKVKGTFMEYTGELNIGEEGNLINDIKVVIDAKSVNTFDKKRDLHLRGHEFFYVAKYPQIEFKAQGPIRIRKDNSFEIPGTIEMRGIKKPIVFHGKKLPKTLDAWGKPSYFYELKSTIQRFDFEMVWNKTLDTGGVLLGDEVSVNLLAQVQNRSDITAFATHMIPHTKGTYERELLKSGKIKKLTTKVEVPGLKD